VISVHYLTNHHLTNYHLTKNGKEANQSLQTNVIYLVYVSRVYFPLCTTKSDE